MLLKCAHVFSFAFYHDKVRIETEQSARILFFFSSLKASFYLSFKDNKLNTQTMTKSLRCMLQAIDVELGWWQKYNQHGTNVHGAVFRLIFISFLLHDQKSFFFSQRICRLFLFLFLLKGKERKLFVTDWKKRESRWKRCESKKCESFCLKLSARAFLSMLKLGLVWLSISWNVQRNLKHKALIKIFK